MPGLFEEMGSTYPQMGGLPDGKLMAHLDKIGEAATSRMELLTTQMTASLRITEALNALNLLAWAGSMNSIRRAAGKDIDAELIYA